MAGRGSVRAPSAFLLPMRLQEIAPRGGTPRILAGRGASLTHPGLRLLSPATRDAMAPVMQPTGLFGTGEPDPSTGALPTDVVSADGAMAPDPSAQPALPEMPQMQVPTLLAAPKQGLAVRAASALADTPAYHPNAYESQGSAIGRGLISGVARGYSSGTLSDYTDRAAGVSAQNVANKTAADSHNAMAQKAWETRLGIAKDDAGNWTITQDQANKYPALSPFVGRSTKPNLIMDAVAKEQERQAKLPTQKPDDKRMIQDLVAHGTLNPGQGASLLSGMDDATRKEVQTMHTAASGGGGDGATGGRFDPVQIAENWRTGVSAPDPSRYTKGQYGIIEGEWSKWFKQHHLPIQSLTDRIADWQQFKSNISTFEGSAFQKLDINLRAMTPSISLARAYSTDLSKVAPRYTDKTVNQLAQWLQSDHNFGTPEQRVAVQRFVSQATAVHMQFAQMLMAGGTPTDKAMEEAEQVLPLHASADSYDAALDVASHDVNIRRDAYDEAKMQRGTNQYAPNYKQNNGTIRMYDPRGRELDVPPDQVERYRGLGAKFVKPGEGGI
jgi:hypothetical protein